MLRTCVRRCSAAAGAAAGAVVPVGTLFRASIRLPETTFPLLRAGDEVVEQEERVLRWWEAEQVYPRLLQRREKEQPFVLHDGPPYANGELHMGHALNKVLKDIVTRYQLLRGKRAVFVPGWDCHGLPIEMKVLQQHKQHQPPPKGGLQLREEAARFAEQTIAEQMAGFRRYGVWALWDERYQTMDPAFEARQLRVFRDMFRKGLIYRGRKPVHWSPSTRTALAEAELEYKDDHESTSVYAGFPVTQCSPALQRILDGQPCRLAIWTTTPWTLPANRAVAVNPDMQYVVVRSVNDTDSNVDSDTRDNGLLVVGEALLPLLQAARVLDPTPPTSGAATLLGRLSGRELAAGTMYQHPFSVPDTGTGTGADSTINECRVIVGGHYIQEDSGTGLVHTAPGHGEEDFHVGMAHGLDVFSPVDDLGRFTAAAGRRFEGKAVLDEGNREVVRALQEANVLLHPGPVPYHHRYPYDWRSKQPVIFRTTHQWFASIDACREDILRHIDRVEWIPHVGANRIRSMVEARNEWCISRQRDWGVPIPAFYDKISGEPVMTEEIIDHIADLVEQHGSNVWWSRPVHELLPPSVSAASADKLEKGTDTMDVWFDSGTSWSGAGASSSSLPEIPYDLYLEGSDQHRGWFQSSLITAVTAAGHAPFRAVLTHGFVLDESGHKMSKSLGNVVDPRDVIFGVDAPPATSSSDLEGEQSSSPPPASALSEQDLLALHAAAEDDEEEGGIPLEEQGLSTRELRKLRKQREKRRKQRKRLLREQEQRQHAAERERLAQARPAMGADVLRLWAASTDYTADVHIGPSILSSVAEHHRKLRGSLRFILGNLSDFDPTTHAVALHELPHLDRMQLARLAALVEKVQAWYDAYQFNRAVHALSAYCVTELSSFYFDVSKDRLYIPRADAFERRACQTVLHTLLHALVSMLAPVLPFLAEEVWEHGARARGLGVFEQSWPDTVPLREAAQGVDEEWWSLVRTLRDRVNKEVELLRQAGLLKTSAQAEVTLSVQGDASQLEAWRGDDTLMPAAASRTNLVDDLRFLLQVSRVQVERGPVSATTSVVAGDDAADGVLGGVVTSVQVTPTASHKCARCWNHCASVASNVATVAEHEAHTVLCTRCQDVWKKR